MTNKMWEDRGDSFPFSRGKRNYWSKTAASVEKVREYGIIILLCTTADNPGSPISAKTYVNGGTTTEARYYYAGNQLSKMTRGDKTLVFTYDSLGPRSVVYNGSNYYYLRNAQGDVLGIVNAYGVVVASYTYDAWGNVLSVTGSMSGTLGTLNPLRYRGYVYDTETKLYYLNSRYYNPATGRFINADIFVSTGQGTLGSNMFAYCNNNPVMGYDPSGTFSFGTLFSGVSLLSIGITACAVAAAAVTAGACLPLLLAATATFTAGGITVLNGASEVVESFTDYNVMRDGYYGGDRAYYEAQRDTFSTVATVGTMVTSAGMASGNVCFIAGTLVQTEDGTKPIEELQPGDRVWAWNEETCEVALKPVVETYVNETDELMHIHVNGQEILTTPGHPFYSPVKGWTSAVQLRAGDILVLVNGEYVIVEQVQHELLEAPVKVYNFNVEDYHTYYVTDSGVLVHNRCGAASNPNEFVGNHKALNQMAKADWQKGSISRADADAYWELAQQLGYKPGPSFHGPRFDSYLGGTQLHIKLFGMHINVL